MNEQPIELGKDAAGKNDGAKYAQAAHALQDEYLSIDKEKAIAIVGQEGSSNELRRAEEQSAFRSKFENQNIALGPLEKGWGPYQALQELKKEHKIDLSDEQLLNESRRIRDRDFLQWGRNYYSSKDYTRLWTDAELDEKVQDTIERVKGIDVSHGQNDIDWKQVKDAGYQFAFIKASEGITIKDDHSEVYRKGAQDAGLRIGYYHYFRPNDSVDAQVKNSVDSVAKPDKNALRLVVDTEDPKIWKPYSVAQRVKMIDDWCKGVQKALGVTPSVSIYGSPDFFNNTLKNPAALAKYDLWLADYNSGEPPVPKPWSNWTFFQYSEHGKVPGISTEVDLDMYMGDNLDQAMLPNSDRGKHKGKQEGKH